MLSIIYGLISSASWGAADFLGGLASKRTSEVRVLFLAEVAGLVPFLLLAIIVGEPIPPSKDLLLAALAIILGLSGLVFLYRALARDQMTVAAPVSALLAALIPVVFGIITLGIPSAAAMIGFGLALLSVWLIAQKDSTDRRLSFTDLRLPLAAGFFFGLYFIIIHEATLKYFFWPLTAARFTGVLSMGLFALATRQPAMPPRETWGLCIFNGVIDIAGNGFYVLAANSGRIDIAAVLGALYPVGTALLAWIILKERVSRIQSLGIVLAFVAIVLFTL